MTLYVGRTTYSSECVSVGRSFSMKTQGRRVDDDIPVNRTVLKSIYSVMQSDGNSWTIDTFREALTSELMTSS